MRRHELLQGLHEVLRPRTYFEIGVRQGYSLRFSRAPTVAVDPFYDIKAEVLCDLHLVRTTSDEFFARPHPFAHFKQPRIDLAFIDGMHLSEFALRDLCNTEKYCHAGSVIILDDMLPRNEEQAGRGRVGKAATGAWAGDVFKIIDSLRRLRPDLVLLELDTEPTGTLMVLLPDPGNTALDGAYDALVRDYVTPDPQEIPEWVRTRSRAIAAEKVLESSVWSEIRRSRLLPPAVARVAVRNAYERAGLASVKEL